MGFVVQNCTILGKKTVGRLETLKYVSERFRWQNCVIGISCYFGFWAWILGRLTKRKVIYYCIDFYSPEIAKNLWDRMFIRLAMLMDRFLGWVVDEVWDISERINLGRWEYGDYMHYSTIVPLSYPPSYFRFKEMTIRDKIVFVGLDPYGLELLPKGINFEWLGREKLLPLEELLERLSFCGIGISLWERKGNNFYGDPGKTKLYLACGIPVIMTNNTPYAKIIKETQVGLVIPYNKIALDNAIKTIMDNYDFYKSNVKKTWKYINADEVFGNLHLLE